MRQRKLAFATCPTTLPKVRMAIVRDAEQWAKVSKKLPLEGDRLSRPPRGFDPDHPFIDDLKMKDFVASVALTEEGLRRQTAARFRLGMPTDVAPGGVHHQGIGLEVLISGEPEAE